MSDDIYESKTSIQVTVKLRERLKELGKKGDTYEEIIWDLIKLYEAHELQLTT